MEVKGRLGLTVIISLCALIILVFIQLYVIREYYHLKSKDFDATYSKIIARSLDDYNVHFSTNPFDTIYYRFNITAYHFLSENMFDSLSLEKPDIRKQIADSFQLILKKLEPNTAIIGRQLKASNLDTTFISEYSINEISLISFNQKIEIYRKNDSEKQSDKDDKQGIYIKSYQVESDYYNVKFDYYVDFTRKAIIIYKEMKGLLIAIICTIVAVFFAFAYTLRMLNRQKKLSQLKSDFIDQITHEFKTPLSTIAVAVSSLKLPGVQQSPDKINELSDQIRKQYQFLTRMIDHVLQTGLIEREKMQINRKSIAVKPFMQDIASTFIAEHAGKNIHIAEFYNVADDFSYPLDSLHFSRVITNLLGNSVKYTTGEPDITISVHKTDALIIEVSDHGIGISKEHLRHVFTKFYRVENNLSVKTGGLGLGLYISKQIVESHFGIINIKSEPDRGTTVIIQLPLKPFEVR